MQKIWAVFLSITCHIYFIQTPLVAASLQRSQPQGDLESILSKSYVELFDWAPGQPFSTERLEQLQKRLEDRKDAEEDRLNDEKDRIEDAIDAARDELKDLNKNPSQSAAEAERRHAIHCRIQSLRNELKQVEVSLDTGIDTAFDNKLAKLKVLRDWPSTHAAVLDAIERGEAGERKFGDPRDIGFRGGVFEDQEDDVETGREVVQEMERRNVLPPEVEDETVVAYINELGQRIARHSDLQVPLNIRLLKSEEINAFALPGGFLFLNSGLVLEAADETQLAGVIAHEIAHVTARHGNRLMGKAQVAGILFQAAQIAAAILTGGVSSLGAYYALQYGFMGLGLIMNLTLLGVSRDYEIEADILGTQYLWDSGYDPRAFVRFFGHMAEKEGYITGASWFRTHPPFYERMEETFREILFLPPHDEQQIDSSKFQQVKQRLTEILEEMKERDKDAPTLKRVFDCEGDTDKAGTPAGCGNSER